MLNHQRLVGTMHPNSHGVIKIKNPANVGRVFQYGKIGMISFRR